MAGVLVRLLRPAPERRWPTDRRSALSVMAGWRGGGGAGTASGLTITPEGSLAVSAVFACVRVLAETVGKLDLGVYERLEGRGQRAVPEHPLSRLLGLEPNPEMTSQNLREALMVHLTLWGNGYCQIERDGAARPAALWPLRPDRVELKREGGRLLYVCEQGDGGRMVLPAEDVLHVRGMGMTGLAGYSPIRLGRESVGLAKASQEYAARFFSNDATPGGLLMHPGVLGDDAHRNLQNSWDARHQGVGNSHRLTILEEGMSYQQVGATPESAQLLETQKAMRLEIASMFRVPPHMIGELDRATFSNIEHQAIQFVEDTITPWVVRWEQALKRSLLPGGEYGRFDIKFDVSQLLRGDMLSRNQAHAIAVQNGWMSRNEVRERENLNAFEGGDEYLVPLNMGPAGGEEEPQGGRGAGEQGEDSRSVGQWSVISGQSEQRGRRAAGGRQRLAKKYRRLYWQALARVLRREANDVGAAAKRLLGKRSRGEFEQWLEEFYREHQGFVVEQVQPAAEAYAGDVAREAGEEIEEGEPDGDVMGRWLRAYLASFAARMAAQQEDRVRQALEQDDPARALETELESWRDSAEGGRGDSLAGEEMTRLGNAVAVLVYGLFGVGYLRWVASGGETCPYCRALDGRVVAINSAFLGAGEAFQPEGAEVPLQVTRRVGHPPAHRGCDCLVVAA